MLLVYEENFSKHHLDYIHELLDPFFIKNTRLTHWYADKNQNHEMLPIYVLLQYLCCGKPQDAREELQGLWSIN